MVGTIANIVDGIVTSEIVLTSTCSVGNVDIWLTCSRNGTESGFMMNLGPW